MQKLYSDLKIEFEKVKEEKYALELKFLSFSA